MDDEVPAQPQTMTDMSEGMDVVVIGAGFAGSCAAHALGAAGLKVLLVDRRSKFPDLFRAEKLEADQSELMRGLGLLDQRSPHCPVVGDITCYRDGDQSRVDTVEQYGISYGDTVNELWASLPETVTKKVDRVVSIKADERAPSVQLADGATIRARVVVLASGGSDALVEGLGARRRFDDTLTSLSFGFDIRSLEPEGFTFRGLNHHDCPSLPEVDYVTVFPIGARMRANVFTRLSLDDPKTKAMRESPKVTLEQWFPGFDAAVGGYELDSKVQMVPTRFHRLSDYICDGVVMIGEEYQSVTPASGLGLSKVLTDVDVLCRKHVPHWLDAGRVGRAELEKYYGDPVKLKSDRKALESWMYYANSGVPGGPSIRRRIAQKFKLLAMR